MGPPGAGDFRPEKPLAPALVRLAVVGDVGTRRPEVHQTARAMADTAARGPFRGLVLLGDNVYPHGEPSHLDAAVFSPFAAVLEAGASLLPVLGNHDVEDGHGDAQAERLGMPGRWYSSRLGPVLFVGLDSNQPGDPGQRAWLISTLAGTDAPWRVVALHHPPYSAGRHRSEPSVRRAFCPLFQRFGVQLVLAGHDHDYQRSLPLGATTYVVSGGGARVRPTARAWFTAVAFATHHFTDLHFYDEHMVVRAVDRRGRVFDEALVRRGERA